MGEFKSGAWIIGIVIYYVFFFSLVAGVDSIYKNVNGQEQSLDFNDPGFQDQQNAFLSSEGAGECVGASFFSTALSPSNPMTILRNVKCDKLIIDHEVECNSINGCGWVNATSLFNFTISPEKCDGNVNKTHYSITGQPRTFCRETVTFQDNASLCYMFGCQWLNKTEMSQDFDPGTGLSTMGQNIKFIVTFRADFGLGEYDWIISFIFFYIPFLMLLWALYMAMPFAH